jgi:hypothetical protein
VVSNGLECVYVNVFIEVDECHKTPGSRKSPSEYPRRYGYMVVALGYHEIRISQMKWGIPMDNVPAQAIMARKHEKGIEWRQESHERSFLRDIACSLGDILESRQASLVTNR